MVVDQPAHHLRLAARRSIEVDGVAAGVARLAAGAGDPGTRAGGGDDPHRPELRLDARQERPRGGRKAGPGGAGARELGEAAPGQCLALPCTPRVPPPRSMQAAGPPGPAPTGMSPAPVACRRPPLGPRAPRPPVPVSELRMAVVARVRNVTGSRVGGGCERTERHAERDG